MVANEEFVAWLTGQKSMPFGPGGEHVTVRLIDFDHPTMSRRTSGSISTEVTFSQGRVEQAVRPGAVVQRVPARRGRSQVAGRARRTPGSTAPRRSTTTTRRTSRCSSCRTCSSFATEGKDFRYGSVGMPVELWGPWRDEDAETDAPAKIGLAARAGGGRRGPHSGMRCSDFLRFFTVFATDNKHRKIKIIARYQQFQATNLIVERVLHGRVKQGLIWHFQGSGKSLLMVFTALKLRATAS